MYQPCDFCTPLDRITAASLWRLKAHTLLKMDLAVDNDRDGEVTFRGTDATSEDEPFRFWLNNDSDVAEVGESPTGAADSSNNEISTKRDLEDFARLSFTTDAIQDQLKNGTIELGFKWKDAEKNPALKIYWSAMSDGSKFYVEDDNEADLNGTNLSSFNDVFDFGFTFASTRFWNDIFGSFRGQSSEWLRSFFECSRFASPCA